MYMNLRRCLYAESLESRVMLAADVAAIVDVQAASIVDGGPAPIYGDANLDGVFNSGDLVQVFQRGEYEDGVAGNSSWGDGDWNGDREFDSADFVAAFKAGSFGSNARAGSQSTQVLTQNPGGLSGVDARLVRTDNGISIRGTFHGLASHETYTLWWIVPDDDPVPLVLNATGGISNSHGDLHFAAALPTGTYDGDPSESREVLQPGTLDDPRDATVIIHLIGHGAPVPGIIPNQISEFNPAGAPQGPSFEAEIVFSPA